MRAWKSGRATRRLIVVALTVALTVGVAVGISSQGGGEARRGPREVSLKAALAAVTGANSYFLRIPGIAGESTDAVHKGEIDIQGFEWGLANPLIGGRATFDDVKLSKRLDLASPLLMKAVAAGTPYASAVLTARKNGSPSFEYATLTLYTVYVQSLKQTGTEVDGVSENISLGYKKIRLRYVKQDPSGGPNTVVTGCWDLTSYTAC